MTKLLLIIAHACILVYLSPLLIDGQDAHILIHDHLDGNHARMQVLARSGQLFASNSTIVEAPLGGLPRQVMGSEFKVLLWLHLGLPPFTALVVNQLLMHFIAFWSMFWLLRRFVLKGDGLTVISLQVGCALTFALVPFWPSGGLSVAGLPLAFMAMYAIRQQEARWWDWLILALLPLYASLVGSFAFFLMLAGGCWCVDAARTRRPNWAFAGAITLMAALFLLVEYRLVLAVLQGGDGWTHRSEFVRPSYPLAEVWQRIQASFWRGQYHAAPLASPLISGTMLAAAVIMIRRRRIPLAFGAALLLLLFTGVIYGAMDWDVLQPVKERIFILRAFNFKRFHWLQPLLWHLLFALALRQLFWPAATGDETTERPVDERPAPSPVTSGVWVTIVAMGLTLMVLAGLYVCARGTGLADVQRGAMVLPRFLRTDWVLEQIRLGWFIAMALGASWLVGQLRQQKRDAAAGISSARRWVINASPAIAIGLLVMLQSAHSFAHSDYRRPSATREPTYRQFFAEPLFASIRKRIGRPQSSYRVLSIGLHPAIALHNGFHTVDGYSSTYPLAYKHRFRRVIAAELKKNAKVRQKFDHWGSRCYAVPAELGSYATQKGLRTRSIPHLELNPAALLQIGTRYIFSSVKIINYRDNGLQLMQRFDHGQSAWTVYVYRVIPPGVKTTPTGSSPG